MRHAATTCTALFRAAEDELMAVATERDRLAPAAEEARWRARQLERQLTDSLAAAETAQTVRPGFRMYSHPSGGVSIAVEHCPHSRTQKA